MKNNKTKTNENVKIKKLVVALTEKIEMAKQKQIGGNFEKEGMFYKTKATFNAKSMNKYQYSQLFALYEFMQENSHLTEVEVRQVLRLKPIKFSFLNKCDVDVDDFLSELKLHGPVYIATCMENKKQFENWAKKHTLR